MIEKDPKPRRNRFKTRDYIQRNQALKQSKETRNSSSEKTKNTPSKNSMDSFKTFTRAKNRINKANDEVNEMFDDQQSKSTDEKVIDITGRNVKRQVQRGFRRARHEYRNYQQQSKEPKFAQDMLSTSRVQNKQSNFQHKARYDFNRSKHALSENTNLSKEAQKKLYQKRYHYKDANHRIKNPINNSNMSKGKKLLNSLSTQVQKLGGAIKNAFSSKIIIVGLLGALILGAIYLVLYLLLSYFGSGLMTPYLFTASEATVIEQRYTDKELDYLEKILEEAEGYTGDFNASINYDPIGHDPHEILSLFNVLFMYEMSVNDEEEYTFDLKLVDQIIDDLIEARYSFKKETKDLVRYVSVENEDGTTSREERVTKVTNLTSTTHSISNIIGGASYSAPANTREFINNIGEDAREIAAKNDLYASVMIAQAILETGSGSSTLSSPPYFNLFGIKGNYNGDSVNMYTQEDDGLGNMYTISDRFRDYPSYKESMLDYAEVMLNQPSKGFYSPTYKRNSNSYKDATAYLTGTYATDTQYGSKLNSIIQQYRLTDYDRKITGSADYEEDKKEKDEKEKIEKILGGNVFALTKYEQELYQQTLDQRGWMGTYEMPISEQDWSSQIKEPYGHAWDESLKKRYTTNGLLLNINSGKNVQTQLTGEVTKITESNGNATVTVKGTDTLTIEYGNLTNINVSKGQNIRKGTTIGQTASGGLLLNVKDEKNKAVNPQLILYSENLRPKMYNLNLFTVNTGSSPQGNNRLNQNMAGKEYDDIDVQRIFDIGKKYIGFPYVFGGASPGTSFDCSGYIYWVFKEAGLKNWGRTTANEIYYQHTAPISESEAKPGDLVFFENTYNAGERFTHIGIYAGDGIMLHAGDPIGFTSFKTNYWQSHNPTFGRLTQD